MIQECHSFTLLVSLPVEEKKKEKRVTKQVPVVQSLHSGETEGKQKEKVTRKTETILRLDELLCGDLCGPVQLDD